MSYEVQVMVRRWIYLDRDAILARLRVWRPDVSLIAEGIDRLVIEVPTDDRPLLVTVFHAWPIAYAESLYDALVWSPHWNERWDETQARCPHSIVIAMLAQHPIHYTTMLLAYLAVFDSVLWSLEPEDRETSVIHWIPSQQLMTFDLYRALRTERGPCGPAVNVRITNTTGRPGELVADTIGLAELGLPDLQLRFRDEEPTLVMHRLRHVVSRLFAGHRLDIPWVEENALLPPARDALTLQPE